MNVSCTNCGKRYVLSDDKVAGKTSVKIRCKQCQSLIAIDVATQTASIASSASGITSSPSGIRASSSAVAMASVQAPVAARSPWEDEATKAMPALDMSAQWHAMIGGAQQGPFDVKALMGKVQAGEVTLRTYLWKAGMADWKRAADVPEVSPLFAGARAPSSSPSQTGRPPPPKPPAAATRKDVAVANEMPSPEVTRPRGGNVADPLPSNQLSGDAPSPEPLQAAATGQFGEFQPSAAPEAAAAPEQQPLNDLFGDLHQQSTTGPSGVHETPSQQQQQPNSQELDPFAAMGPAQDGELPPPGEATKFFIAQAGVNKRNPPWKIALFVFSIIGLPTAVLYLLSTFQVVQLPTVTRTTEDGREVQESFFSGEGMVGLKDMLTGDAKRKREEAERKQKERELAIAQAKARAAQERGTGSGTGAGPNPEVEPKKQPPSSVDYAMLEDENKRDRGPRDREGGNKALASSGLKDDVAGKVVSDNMKSFSLCIEEALRRNPNLKVGAITVNLTVGASGAVTAAHIAPAQHENTDWGACMMKAGKRIVFPSSDGETEVQVPLKLGVAM